MSFKNLSLILNGVLLLAVAHLYYLNFSKKTDTTTAMPAGQEAPGLKIAYINIDTLDAKYEWALEQKKALENKIQAAGNSLNRKKEALMNDAGALQQKQPTMTPVEFEKAYRALGQREARLAEEEQKLNKQFAEETQQANKTIWTNMETQLKTLQGQLGVDYILGYSKGGGAVLLANDSLEITTKVLDLLNAKAGQ